MSKLENSGKAVIEDGVLIIRVVVTALPTVVEGAWAAKAISTRYKVTNANEFAADLVHELNAESEDGTTLIHKMFDSAIAEALEQGARGIEEHEKQDV